MSVASPAVATLRALLAEQGQEVAQLQVLAAALDARQCRLNEALTMLMAQAVAEVEVAPATVPVPVRESASSTAVPATAAPVCPPTVEALCDYLESFDKRLKTAGTGLEPADYAFLSRVRQVLTQPGQDVTARLIDVLGFCDRLGAPLLGSVWRPLHQELSQARTLLHNALPQYRFLQITGPGDGIQVVFLPVSAPIVTQTGLVDPTGVTIQPAMAVLPYPTGEQLSPRIALGWALAEELHGLMRQTYRKGLKEDLQHLTQEILRSTASSQDTATSLRNLLNIHTRWMENVDAPAAKRCLDLLHTGHQLRSFSIAVGERFDPDRHDLKRYDRVERSSTQAPGTVIGLRQIGISDANGLPVQKCLALVSA